MVAEIYVTVLDAPPSGGPVLSGAAVDVTGTTTATIRVTTDTATGTLYTAVTTSATPPSSADLKAGTGAVFADDQTITTTGEKSFSATGLTAATGYYAHCIHNDGTDDSNITTVAFTTDADVTALDWSVNPAVDGATVSSITVIPVIYWSVAGLGVAYARMLRKTATVVAGETTSRTGAPQAGNRFPAWRRPAEHQP
jgi:hypothetical protein